MYALAALNTAAYVLSILNNILQEDNYFDSINIMNQIWPEYFL